MISKRMAVFGTVLAVLSAAKGIDIVKDFPGVAAQAAGKLDRLCNNTVDPVASRIVENKSVRIECNADNKIATIINTANAGVVKGFYGDWQPIPGQRLFSSDGMHQFYDGEMGDGTWCTNSGKGMLTTEWEWTCQAIAEDINATLQKLL